MENMAKKILIVDDDESILDAVAMILEEQGYTVKTTFKGDETYKKVDSFKPDLIILDVLLSGKDGREICKNLKESLPTKQIPIIMISAHPNAEKTIKACGANDFLPKPFDTDELIKKVSQCIIKKST